MNRKGITPVIAVVLLLLITVGAVASAWGLYQQVTGDTSQIDDLNQRQLAENTQISIESVFNSGDDYTNVTLRNNGGEPVNLSGDVRLLVSPDGSSEYLNPNLLESNYDIGTPANSECFSDGGEVLTVEGDNRNLNCNTSVEFPAAAQDIGFRITYRDVEGYNWDFECRPSASDSVRCG